VNQRPTALRIHRGLPCEWFIGTCDFAHNSRFDERSFEWMNGDYQATGYCVTV